MFFYNGARGAHIHLCFFFLLVQLPLLLPLLYCNVPAAHASATRVPPPPTTLLQRSMVQCLAQRRRSRSKPCVVRVHTPRCNPCHGRGTRRRATLTAVVRGHRRGDDRAQAVTSGAAHGGAIVLHGFLHRLHEDLRWANNSRVTATWVHMLPKNSCENKGDDRGAQGGQPVGGTCPITPACLLQCVECNRSQGSCSVPRSPCKQ